MNKCCYAFLIWAALLSFGMTGCVTHELNEKIRSDKSYTEEVSSVLMSEDGEKLVFIGDGYHYVFDTPLGLSQSLHSSLRKSLFAEFKEFRVDKNDHVIGDITISLDESASQEDKEEAMAIGYDKRLVSPALDISLQGKRYKSSGVATDRAEYKLNYKYKDLFGFHL